jgi:hypothetical protein
MSWYQLNDQAAYRDEHMLLGVEGSPTESLEEQRRREEINHARVERPDVAEGDKLCGRKKLHQFGERDGKDLRTLDPTRILGCLFNTALNDN